MEHEVDWFGNPVRRDADMRPVEPVPCPHCGAPFDTGSGMRTHLVQAHGAKAAKPVHPLREPGRFRRWVESLAYLPFWYVVPINLGFSGLLLVAWWSDFAILASDDPSGFAKTWMFVLSLLPVTCYLAARVATIGRGD